jgi:HSP20 family protein
VPQFSFIPAGESRDLADDIRELFEDLALSLKHEQRAYSGECQPTLDVLETDEAIHVVVDVPGVPRDALRVVFRTGVLIVAGEKAPSPIGAQQSYHLVEREFGRFARAVRVTGAFDIQHARASLGDGELKITLPKIDERRGRACPIAVVSADVSADISADAAQQ